MPSAAFRAGQAYRRMKAERARTSSESDPYAPELEWPALRRAILAKGGLGPSRDWDREDYPGDLYREHGLPPDVMAEELTLGKSDTPPWGAHADDDAMIRYLRGAHHEYQQHPERRHSIADPELAARRRQLREAREAEARRVFGAGRLAREQGAHHSRIQAMIAAARAQRQARYPRPAVGFYTDDAGEVRPITKARG